MVIKFTTNLKHIDFKTVEGFFPSFKYGDSKFSGGVLKIDKCCFLLFSNGKINITGIKSEGEAVEKLLWLLYNLQIEIEYIKYNVVNITAFTQIKVNFKRFCSLKEVMYEPELFPAAYLDNKVLKTKIILFHTGKIIITGAKCYNHILQTYIDFLDFSKQCQ